jgi:hypothetical protein
MKKEFKMSNDYDDVNINDEDLEFDEDDFDFVEEDDSDTEEEVGEYIALPFFSMHCSQIPSKFNPVNIMEKDDVLLFNPLDSITPYRRIKSEGLSLVLLTENLIVTRESLKDNYNISNKNEINKTMMKNKEIIKGFIVEDEDEETGYAPEKKNDYGKSNKGGSFAPKNTPKNFIKKQ